ncbi:hypothetical protein IGM03_002467 [Enterococcus sp. DIV0436]
MLSLIFMILSFFSSFIILMYGVFRRKKVILPFIVLVLMGILFFIESIDMFLDVVDIEYGMFNEYDNLFDIID